MKSYEIGEHTADLSLKAWGRDRGELFCNAARGMLDYIVPAPPGRALIKKRIDLAAASPEELFVSWLNEILFWLERDGLRFEKFHIHELTPLRLRAVGEGKKLDLASLATGPEIKAATYHDLYIRETPSGWEAHVILDL